jgi:hypothetical protein
MDSDLIVAIVTSVCTAGSTAGVAITALILQNKRVDRIEAKIDALENRIGTGLDSLTGAMHDACQAPAPRAAS